MNTYTLLLLLLAGCGAEGSAMLPEGAPERQAVEVEVVDATRQPLALSVRATGTSRPVRAADLTTPVSGRIGKILVVEGQEVAEGAALLKLDGVGAHLSATQARASADAAEAQARQLEADVERLRPLADRGTITASRLDQLVTQRDTARAHAEAARAAASAAGSSATDTTLRAPFAGTVVDIRKEVGEMASGDVIRLVDFSALEIGVEVQGRDLGRLAEGDRVVVRFPATDQRVEGEVRHIGLEIDPATRTAEVVVTVPNPERSLRSGMFAELEIQPSRTRDAMVVPRTAVAGSGSGAAVYVVVDGHTQRREVSMAPFGPDTVEILSGLDVGDHVVARNVTRVTEGTPVEVRAADGGAL